MFVSPRDFTLSAATLSNITAQRVRLIIIAVMYPYWMYLFLNIYEKTDIRMKTARIQAPLDQGIDVSLMKSAMYLMKYPE